MSKQLLMAKIATNSDIDVGHYPADLKSLQQYVGGLIQPVQLLPDGTTLLVNEEGKIGLAPLMNPIATMLLEFVWGFGHDYAVGDAVVLGTSGENFGDLTDEGFALVTRAVEACQQRARI